MFQFLKRSEQQKPTRRPALQVESLDERALPSVFTVSGQANIYDAGLPSVVRPPSPGGGGGGVHPTAVSLLSLGMPTKVDFPSVTGTVSGWAAAGGYNGPDGGHSWGGKTVVPSYGGISGISDNNATMFLVGVFLGPTGQPATPPKSVDVSNANTSMSSHPSLGQQFFIGDGHTSTGVLQTVDVPAGATMLYLGFAEGFGFGQNRLPGYYSDNGGALTVEVSKPLLLTSGQKFTYDQEGMKQTPYHPTSGSGVTIGVGYDLLQRSRASIISDLTRAGVDLKTAETLAGGAMLSGKQADDFVKTNAKLAITVDQARYLFVFDYEDKLATVQRIVAKPDVVSLYGKTDWQNLNQKIKDMLVDMTYRGDYTPGTRSHIQKSVAANNPTDFKAAISDKSIFPANLSIKRFNARIAYMNG